MRTALIIIVCALASADGFPSYGIDPNKWVNTVKEEGTKLVKDEGTKLVNDADNLLSQSTGFHLNGNQDPLTGGSGSSDGNDGAGGSDESSYISGFLSDIIGFLREMAYVLSLSVNVPGIDGNTIQCVGKAFDIVLKFLE